MESTTVSRIATKGLIDRIRAFVALPEAVATILTVVVFAVSYIFESHDNHNVFLFRGIFLFGALLLCGIVIYGVTVRHYVRFVSPVIISGACMIGVSQLVGFMEVVPFFSSVPLVGPQGYGYLVHMDDMLLYPGFILMLGGFYMSILHANQMRLRLVEEGRQKEEALLRSTHSAGILERRVAFENLAAGISNRFISVDQHGIDEEITRSLEAVGQFSSADRACFVVSRDSLLGKVERYEWCENGVQSLMEALRPYVPGDFRWSHEQLEKGETIVMCHHGDLPAQAALEQEWVERYQIKSLIRLPIMSRGRLRGYIGMDSERCEVRWPEETVLLLRMIGEVLLTAWDRRCVARQRALLELQVQQAQKMESLGVMAGGIAHDFNNILTGIMGNAELLQLTLEETDESRKCLEGIMQSGRRAAELCRQMLAYSGRGKFQTEIFSLNTLVSEMMPLLRASVSRRASFESDLAEKLPDLSGDSAQFRQILVNLVTNASEALEDRRGSVTIKTGVQYCSVNDLQSTFFPELLPAGDYVYLEIADSGSGIPEEATEKIFEPFYTTRFAGRGLGLPAVLGIVRSHKGALHMKTAPGEGTVFRLYFPVEDTAEKNFVASGEVLGDWHGHGTVLLADDEEMVLSVGMMMLKHLGLDVVTAADADEALVRAREHGARLQCIILDLSMPHMDGDNTCARFKQAFPDVPIVITSGYMKESVEHHFTSGHVAAFLPKPFELYNIQPLMHGLLESTRKRTQPVSGS